MALLGPQYGECHTLDGFTGKAVQLLLFSCCCASLWYKYVCDEKRRTTWEFCLDSSKQIFGSALIHVLNLLVAHVLDWKYDEGDECDWYWINIVVDCTFGVLVSYLLLLAFTHNLKMFCPSQADDLKTGVYHDDEQRETTNYSKYAKQLLMWLLIVTLMKACMVLMLFQLHPLFLAFAKIALSPFRPATGKLLIVMIVTPLCMNAFQFWITDNFIQRWDKDNLVEDPALNQKNASRIKNDGDL